MEWSDYGGLEGAGLGALEQSSSGARSLPAGGSPALCVGGSEYGGGPLGLVQRHLRRERGLALSIAGPAPPLGDACSQKLAVAVTSCDRLVKAVAFPAII